MISKSGSQEQVPKQGFQKQLPSKVPRNKFPRFQEQCLKFPRKSSKNRFACRVARLPSKVLGNRFPSKVSTNRSQARCPRTGLQASFARTGSQARVRRTGSQELVQVPRTNSPGRFRAIGCQHGSHEHVPKHRSRLLMFPGTAFQEQLAKRNFNICKQGWKQEQNPKQGSEGQVPKQGSQAKLRKPGSRARSQ